MTNDWAAYQVDDAVVWIGIAVENAVQERVKEGADEHAEWRDKYTLEQILEPDFRLPRPLTHAEQRRAIGAQIKAMFGMGGPRKGRAKKDAAPKSFLPPSLAAQWLARGRTL